MNAETSTMTDKFKKEILKIVPEGVKGKITTDIETMDIAELFLWLAKQDPSLRHYLALELDIPLQHLTNTCMTMKHLAKLSV